MLNTRQLLMIYQIRWLNLLEMKQAARDDNLVANSMAKGAAGFPLMGLCADLYDGSYHAVDSDEISFKTAASLAYKKCLEEAAPVILEPVGDLLITVPESESSQLEILAVNELRHTGIREHCLMIVGIAMGKTEAQSMVEALVFDVYSDRHDADIRAWLSEEHG